MNRSKARRIVEKPPSPSNIVCYCEGEREIGTALELYCNGCQKWFHQRCLKDLPDLWGPHFMVCYTFHCRTCSPTSKETWVLKSVSFTHMCVTALANLTADFQKERGTLGQPNNEMVFFNLQDKIIPYIEKNWENLTSMAKRQKTTWHSTIQKTLANSSDLFKAEDSSETSFALVETNLGEIGPASEAVKQIGKKSSTEKQSLASTLVAAQQLQAEKTEQIGDLEGPKTRGASKRRNADAGDGKKAKVKNTVDYSSAKVAGIDSLVDFPFNKEGYHYFLAERDPNVVEKGTEDEEDSSARIIPPYLYRLHTPNQVTLSPNDRAFQLRLSEDHLTVTGSEGYSVARATHGVSAGTYYYEVQFLRQPKDSHVRIGWCQRHSPLQACVGYSKFSYGWRSHKGTKFHDSHGLKYHFGGYKEGDTLGCLIYLPWDKTKLEAGSAMSGALQSLKDQPLIKFKHNHFFEAHEDSTEAKKTLTPLIGSRMEFFHNGKSCGVAYENVYEGTYFPAVSLFGNATLKCNFGPDFKYALPRSAQPIQKRAFETHYEQTLADLLHIVNKDADNK